MWSITTPQSSILSELSSGVLYPDLSLTDPDFLPPPLLGVKWVRPTALTGLVSSLPTLWDGPGNIGYSSEPQVLLVCSNIDFKEHFAYGRIFSVMGIEMSD